MLDKYSPQDKKNSTCNDKPSFESNIFNFSLKSAAGVALGLLAIIAYFGAGAFVSEYRDSQNSSGHSKFNKKNEEIAYDFNHYDRDPEVLKKKGGIFDSMFCSGNKRSKYCN